MADLIVELFGTRLGVLRGDWRTFDFAASHTAVEAFGIDSQILSVAVPLAAVPTRTGKDRRQNFFRELLPEGHMLTQMAQGAGHSEHDAIGMLRSYGRDIAGAVQIWDPDISGEPKPPSIEPLDHSGVADVLRNVRSNPLGNKPIGGKTSLAGVQDKVVLAHTQDGWNRVIDGYPSSHILKPESQDYPTTIYDEEYGSRFTRALGLSSFQTVIEYFDDTPALVIERYDRSDHVPHGRIHQEDFNQALGASGIQKYQKFGGKVSLARIASLLTSVADRDSLRRLLKMVVLAAALGNLDMHAKNLSLLHLQDGRMSLAPAYDFVPQTHQPNDQEMALAIDQEYKHRAITRKHLIAEGESWGVKDAEAIVNETLDVALITAQTEDPHGRAHPRLKEDIMRFTSNLIAGNPAGESRA